MIPVDLPPKRSGHWIGVVIERHNIAGTPMLAVTVRGRGGKPTERHWNADEAHAMAFAVHQADLRALPLLDMRGGDPE